MPTLVLLHSPLVGPSTWAMLAPELESLGFPVAVPSLTDTARGEGPYGPAFASTVRDAVPGDEPVVLVAHSGAGLFAPPIAAGFEDVAACIFVDATIPRDGMCWMDTLDEELRESDAFREAAARGVVPNPWRGEAPWRQVGIVESGLVARLAEEAIDPPLAMYEERIALPPGWPGIPKGYLAFVPNPFYAPIVREARDAGLLVREMPGGHFEMVARPGAVARELAGMVSVLTG